ncbi:MAG: hypothetical protein WBB22_01050 [Anaerolineae bacterium]
MSARNANRGSLLAVALVAALLLPLGVLPAFSEASSCTEASGAAAGLDQACVDNPEPDDSVPGRHGGLPADTGGSIGQVDGATFIAYSVDSDDTDRLWEIELSTGVATPIGPTGFNDIDALSFSATGVLYGVDDENNGLVTCDPNTGACSSVGPLGVAVRDMGLAFDGAARLWMATEEPLPSTFYSLSPLTGAAAVIGVQGQRVTGLAFRNGVLYGLGGDYTNNLVTIDRASGTATVVGSLLAVSLADGGIDFDGNGSLWGIGDPSAAACFPSQIFTINRATGVATLVATVVDGSGTARCGFDSLAIWPLEGGEEPFVPEAGTILLLGSGLMGLAGYATLRRRAVN